MRHMARRKKPKLNSFTKNKLLRSITKGKSTYFYKQWPLKRKTQASNPANGFRVSLSSLRENSGSPEAPSAIQTRLSRKVKNPYSGIARLGSTYFLPVVCMAALLLVAGLAFNPIFSGGEEVHAADDTAQGLSYLDPAISLSMVSYPEEPTEAWAGGLSFIWGKLEYNLNQIDSAALYLTMDEGNDVDLVSEDGLTRLTGADGRKGTEMEYNTWGYRYADKSYVLTQENLQNGTYYAVPAYGEFGTSAKTGRLFNTSNYAVDGGGHLVFAAKFAPNASAGHYRANVLLSLVAQPKAIAVEFSGFSNVTYMQDMNWAICGAAKIGETKQLIDRRDSKKYWVTKEADGSCWMTQNLDLDLSSSTTLTSATTDIPSDWTPANSTQTGSSPNFTTEKNDVQSYDRGNYFCANNTTEKCTLTTSRNNGHDAVGNYYSYNAATAGQATELYAQAAAAGAGSRVEATQSICPKNWRLPAAGINDDLNNRLTDKSFYKLVHGLRREQVIGTAPYYITLSGYIDKTYYYNSGREGFLWSSTATAGGAFGLLTSNTYLGVQNGKGGAEGRSVRCVVRAS